MSGLYEELKRRNVFRVATVYIIFAWLFGQVISLAAENFGAPPWVMSMFIVLLVLGFPGALYLAWAFELTPDGIKLEKNIDRSQSITQNTGQRLDILIVGILVIAVAYSLIIRFGDGKTVAPEPVSDPSAEQDDTGVSTTDGSDELKTKTQASP